MKRLIVLMMLVILLAQVMSCSDAIGALVMKSIKLTLTAPPGSQVQPTLRADRYRVYFSTNPDDIRTKPLSALTTLIAKNRPGVPGTADSVSFDHMFQTGRHTYYVVFAERDVWVQNSPDTTRGDSTLMVVSAVSRSNFAYRYFPPEGENPGNITTLN